jgi:hypothetical protein
MVNPSTIGQIFTKETQAIFYNYKEKPVQRMLDFDFVSGKEVHIIHDHPYLGGRAYWCLPVDATGRPPVADWQGVCSNPHHGGTGL